MHLTGRPAVRRGCRFLAAALTGLWWWGGAGTAAAATFTVDPTQIYLSGRTGSALLTLHNQSTETLRFQLSVFAWTQTPAGEMELVPTEDIVFFPALLTLKPSEMRRIRIGSATTPAAREKTYRIFVEELPPAEKTTEGVRVLTKMGIPIFVRPAKEVATATLVNLRQQDGGVRFTLNNAGTVHIVPQGITVRGLAGSEVAFEKQLDGWYVLAGGRRDFEMALPEESCARVTSIVAEVQFATGRVQEHLQTPAGVCAP